MANIKNDFSLYIYSEITKVSTYNIYLNIYIDTTIH